MASKEICRLCFKSVLKENSEVIGEVHTEILDVLLIKLNVSVSEFPSICTDCWEELQDLFSFKSKCMEIEDSLTPIRQSNNKEFSEITQQSIKTENGVDEIVCRLCMNVTTNENKLKDCNEIITKFLPEIVLDYDSKTFLCSQCLKSLQNYSNFAEICSDWEDKLKLYIQMFGLRKKRKFRLETFLQNLDKLKKTSLQNAYEPLITENYLFSSNDNEVEIKHELTEVEDGGLSTINDFEINGAEVEEKCEKIDEDGSKKRKRKKCHEPLFDGVTSEVSGTTLYHCSICSFSSKHRFYLKKHEEMHQRDGKKFKCPECPLETVYKECLRKHIDTVHNPNAKTFKCNECDFETKHKISIVRHNASHKKNTLKPPKESQPPKVSQPKKKRIYRKIFYCDMCEYETKSSFGLKEHKRCVHCLGEQHIFKCDKCGFFTKRKSSLKKHLGAHESKKKSALYKCPHCEFTTFETHCLKKHVVIHQVERELDVKECILETIQVEKPFKCSECDEGFFREKAFLKHQLLHTDKKPYQCLLCPYKAKTMKNLDSHKIVHRNEIFSCELCSFKTKTQSRLKLHMIKHKAEPKLYKCNLCSFESKWQVSYNTHMNAIHLKKIFECETCGYKTPHRRTIISHRLIHIADQLPTLKCDKCDFTTKRKDSMRAHQLVHRAPSDLIMFKCTLCPFETKYKRSLRNHIRDIHENESKRNQDYSGKKTQYKEKKFICPKCQYATKEKGLLKRHISGTHGDQIFSCEECSYKSTDKKCLGEHIKRVHKATEIFKCKECDFETKYAKSLTNHVSNKHEKWEIVKKGDHSEIKRDERTS